LFIIIFCQGMTRINKIFFLRSRMLYFNIQHNVRLGEGFAWDELQTIFIYP